MVKAVQRQRGKQSQHQLSELVRSAMHPLARKRGFATADLIGSWPDLVGERYKDSVQPGKLIWPRRQDVDGMSVPEPATLVVHADAASALLFAHELPQLRERINSFLGWNAVDRIKIVQRYARPKPKVERARPRALSSQEQATIKNKVQKISNPRLQEALERLGKEIASRSPAA
ncbi:DUF721 domain-containing protein [Rhodobacteraceae bacterium RKSG542]|uniref:DUF721 domain-containing protein n=1 Tax=Pseudovibrio flavus TaxID=2529854 RepID=UPI0012BCDDEB|nr:DciA family protein [Pseudovibrio flavus]MTI18675.1 DUF721 domain-containing protein [Pseudovibrio flavus]